MAKAQYTYLTDELGHILETHLPSEATEPTLTPMRKPMRPVFVDTPEKKAMWDSYWNNVETWWEGERANERRSEWR